MTLDVSTSATQARLNYSLTQVLVGHPRIHPRTGLMKQSHEKSSQDHFSSTSLPCGRNPICGRLLRSSFSSASLVLVKHENSYRLSHWVQLQIIKLLGYNLELAPQWHVVCHLAPLVLNCPAASWDVGSRHNIDLAFAVCVSNKLSKSIWTCFVLSSYIYGNVAS